jgi:hypothetical protein
MGEVWGPYNKSDALQKSRTIKKEEMSLGFFTLLPRPPFSCTLYII